MQGTICQSRAARGLPSARRLALFWMLIGFLACQTTGAWAEPWESLGPPGSTIPALAIAPSQPTTSFIEVDGVGVYASTDSGTTWEPKGYFVICGNVCDLVVHLTDPDIVLALEGTG